jgi:hypothetical protein
MSDWKEVLQYVMIIKCHGVRRGELAFFPHSPPPLEREGVAHVNQHSEGGVKGGVPNSLVIWQIRPGVAEPRIMCTDPPTAIFLKVFLFK